MKMAQSTSTYTCALEKEYNFADLEREDTDDLQESLISGQMQVVIALLSSYFIFTTFAAILKFVQFDLNCNLY